MVVMLALVAVGSGPLEAICVENNFTISRSVTARNGNYEFLSAKHESGSSAFTLTSVRLKGPPAASFFFRIDAPRYDELLYGGRDQMFKAIDGAPAGVFLSVPPELRAVRRQQLEAGQLVQACLVQLAPQPSVTIVSSLSETYTPWDVVGYEGRSASIGSKDKAEFTSCLMALARWQNSQTTTTFGFTDNIQRVAGREMVTKVDKDQNVYVDMNELSRHRGWNFTISLEPARADVRIGNDHIKIYPGADRIHINDELVTLPGTVPTQGYGVYLPLRLLQERGYLPAEG